MFSANRVKAELNTEPIPVGGYYFSANPGVSGAGPMKVLSNVFYTLARVPGGIRNPPWGAKLLQLGGRDMSEQLCNTSVNRSFST